MNSSTVLIADDDTAIRTVLSTFAPDTRPVLQEIEHVAGGFYAWGVKPGARNQRTWARMRAGDPVLWVSNGAYRYVAWVIHRFRNAAAGVGLGVETG